MTKNEGNTTTARAIAARLESVRTETGYEDSVRAFWARLKDGPPPWEEPVSYEAVRRYHWKREPPVRYLARVVDVFPEYRLAWLATGEGSKTKREEEERLRRRLDTPTPPLLDAVAERHPWLRGLSVGVQETFLDVLRALEGQTPGGPISDVEGAEAGAERLELADDLVFLLTLPLRSWGFRSLSLRAPAQGWPSNPLTRQGPDTDVDAYLRQMLGALVELQKAHPGDRAADRPAGLLASLRRAVEGDRLPRPSEEERERAERVQVHLDERMAEWEHVERVHAALADQQQQIMETVREDEIRAIMAEVEAEAEGED